MSGYSRSYSEYLGKNRCCDLRGVGPIGPEGPTGPAGVGPVGPAGINTTIAAATYSSTTSALAIPNQYNPIVYYSVTLPSASDTITTINFGIFPTGYQAIILVDGTNGTSASPCIISNTIINVNTSLGTSGLSLSSDGTNGYATMTIYNFGSHKLCNVIGYNN
jgi:hypothetical protein